ncbi:hypothetical protein [Hymenobacter ginkgonis]|nr:hypothetical protein [Hymenobacter ginkgonis]
MSGNSVSVLDWLTNGSERLAMLQAEWTARHNSTFAVVDEGNG